MSRICDPKSAARFFYPLLSSCSYEHGIAIYLDGAGNIAGATHIPGDISSIFFPLRMMVESALQCSASKVILIHNHPSGNAEPSEADRRLTRTFDHVFNAIDIELVDHVIISNESWTSFRQRGLI